MGLDAERGGIGEPGEALKRAPGGRLNGGPARLGGIADQPIHRAAVLDEQRGAAQRAAFGRGGEGSAHGREPVDARADRVAAREAVLRQERMGGRIRGRLLGE